MKNTIIIEDLRELIDKAHKGDEEAIIEYAEQILCYSNEICTDPFLKRHVDQYALDMLEELSKNGNQEAKDIIDDYFFSDDEYRE